MTGLKNACNSFPYVFISPAHYTPRQFPLSRTDKIGIVKEAYADRMVEAGVGDVVVMLFCPRCYPGR